MNKSAEQLKKEVEAILFYEGEPLKIKDIAKTCEVSEKEIHDAISSLETDFENRGVVIMHNNDKIALGTHPDASGIIEKLVKDEVSRDLGKASLETLSIILYKTPISKREIDYIRGVNSSYILRNLLIRGLIDRSIEEGERSHVYKPTTALLAHLGITKLEDLPNRENALKELEEFSKKEGSIPEEEPENE